MLVNARRLLAALALAGCGVAVGTLPAHAGTAADAKRATDVFSGTVTSADKTPRKGGEPATATYDVEVATVYKGDVGTAVVKVTSTRTSKACERLDLDRDRDYVFFVEADGSELTSDTCSGTDKADDRLVGKVEEMLGGGRQPTPQRPEQAVFTRVADAEPASLTRMAAPGIALVLAGLLGLVVVRRVGSRG